MKTCLNMKPKAGVEFDEFVLFSGTRALSGASTQVRICLNNAQDTYKVLS